MTTHKFSHSGDAYDACQCDATIKDGDMLFVTETPWLNDDVRGPTRTIVALAWTWPVAVTVEHGHLHTPADDCDVHALAEDAGWTREQVWDAIVTARTYELPIHPAFERFK